MNYHKLGGRKQIVVQAVLIPNIHSLITTYAVPSPPYLTWERWLHIWPVFILELQCHRSNCLLDTVHQSPNSLGSPPQIHHLPPLWPRCPLPTNLSLSLAPLSFQAFSFQPLISFLEDFILILQMESLLKFSHFFYMLQASSFHPHNDHSGPSSHHISDLNHPKPSNTRTIIIIIIILLLNPLSYWSGLVTFQMWIQ